jgi:hypothetical protein
MTRPATHANNRAYSRSARWSIYLKNTAYPLRAGGNKSAINRIPFIANQTTRASVTFF